MNLTPFFDALQNAFGAQLPTLLGAMAIALVGWLLALLLQKLSRRSLAQLRVNARLTASVGSPMELERPLGWAVFGLALLITAISVFNLLGLVSLSTPFATLLQDVIGYAPHLLAGSALSLVAWLLATLARALVGRSLGASRLDQQFGGSVRSVSLSRSAAQLVFWLVLLMLLPSVLAAFQLTGTLGPVQNLLEQALGLLPKLSAAAVIALVGWLVARLARGLVSNLLATAGLDQLGSPSGKDHQTANEAGDAQRSALNGPNDGPNNGLQPSALVGTLVYFFVLVPALIAALEALDIAAISSPASLMLGQLMSALPHVLAAALILSLSWFITRFVAKLVAQLLHSAGLDALPAKMGLGAALSGPTQPSQLARWAVLVFGMLFAVIEAANQLGFQQMRDLISSLLGFAGDIALGTMILSIGFWLANLASAAIKRASAEGSSGLAPVARIAILGLVLAMGLRAMGIANEIVALAFGLTLGAVAVAVALSFGLGGRETAGKVLAHWFERWRGPR